MIVKVVGNPDSHTTTIGGARLVQGVVFRKVGNDKKLSISLKKDLPDEFYKYSFDISTNVSKSLMISFSMKRQVEKGLTLLMFIATRQQAIKTETLLTLLRGAM